MKRFYKMAEAGTAPGGFVVRLDGKILKTPLRHNMILSDQAQAQAIAAEWNAQGAEVIPSSMPQMQLACTMIDKAEGHERAAMNAEIVKYASSDLLCYFGTHPADLLKRQEDAWLPLLAQFSELTKVQLKTTKGIKYLQQEDAHLKIVADIVSRLSPRDFTAVQLVTAITGSFVIAYLLSLGKINAEQAYLAACVDEIYQLETWGDDMIARKRLERMAFDLAEIERFKGYL